MNQGNQETFEEIGIETHTTLSRRTLTESFGLALVALMSGPAVVEFVIPLSSSELTWREACDNIPACRVNESNGYEQG